MLIEDPEAKGASVDQIVKEFDRLHSLLSYMGAAGSGVFSMAGLPGSAWTGLCTFFDEELKLWCFSSVMLGYVGEGIEAGSFDTASSEKSAQKCCGLSGRPDHFGMNLTNALVAGFVAGVGEDAFGWLISDPLAQIFGTDPIVSGISGGLVSLKDPFPGLGTTFLNDLTNAVSPSRQPDAPAAQQHGSPGNEICRPSGLRRRRVQKLSLFGTRSISAITPSAGVRRPRTMFSIASNTGTCNRAAEPAP